MKNPVHPEYAAWRTAADTVSDMTFDEYRKRLVHETPEIRRFLAETRAEHFIISAPKGFGKTLLLIAKRMQLNEHSPELDHGGEMVDRPAGNFEELSKDRTKEYKSNFDYWRRIWSYCIAVAAINTHNRRKLKAGQGGMDLTVERPDDWTQDLLKSGEPRSPTLIFTKLLDLDYSTRQKALGSLNRLSVVLADLQSQIAFFIDNVDEYFAPALENRSLAHVRRHGGDDQQKSNEIWINAQLALVSVAFQTHKVNHHIRVYCTVRREAFLKLQSTPAEYHQILGCTVEISYNLKDLLTIFKKNVELMGQDGLFLETPADDPIGRFFGPPAKELRHRFVSQSETAFAFLLRHTFYRPRDLMTICGKISLIAVEDRNPVRIKEEIEAESIQLVQGVFTEMKPFFRLPDPEQLLPCIRKNILTFAEVESICKEYLVRISDDLESLQDDPDDSYRHPFCVLHQIGMLGWIVADQGEKLEDIQRFVKPREVEVGKGTGLPPTERFYLIHPALDRMIMDRVGKEYSRQFHRSNIIGFDLPWQEPPASLFVVKGDVCGFSRIMDSELYETASVKLHEWAKTACDDLDFVEVTGGDSITMIDGSAEKVVACMFKLLRRAEQYKECPLCFRFGGSAGPIVFQRVKRRIGGKWEDIQLPLGQALRSSARLEPHAARGRLLADESFVQNMGQATPRSLSVDELLSEDAPHLLYNSEARLFTVQKSTTDPPLKTRLYYINFVNGGDS